MKAEILVEHEKDLYGTWHTHPEGSANLSEQDYMGFRNWPRLRHYIIGKNEIRCFELQDNFVIEVKN
jgi:proteasome lid subunit RPN8/RPN11